MEKKGNDCYNCPYRRAVVGSAHSECEHPGVGELGFMFALALMQNIKAAEPAIYINPSGAANGWANWPINFDPIWITCNLKIETDEPR